MAPVGVLAVLALAWTRVAAIRVAKRQAMPKLWVCSNKWCRERNAAVPLGSGIALAAGTNVDVRSHKCFGRCAQGPNVAVLAPTSSSVLQFHRVDSVEKVRRIMEHYLGVKVDENAAKCLELNFEANAALNRGEPALAVWLYSAALETGHVDQAGVVLAGRSTARLELARGHRRGLDKYASEFHHAKELRELRMILAAIIYAAPFQRAPATTPLMSAAKVCANGFSDMLCSDAISASVEFDASMFALETRRALSDAAAAAQLLPSYAKCWQAQAVALEMLGRHDDAREMHSVALALLSDSGRQTAS